MQLRDRNDLIGEAQGYSTRGVQLSGTRIISGSASPRCAAASLTAPNESPSAMMRDSSAEGDPAIQGSPRGERHPVRHRVRILGVRLVDEREVGFFYRRIVTVVDGQRIVQVGDRARPLLADHQRSRVIEGGQSTGARIHVGKLLRV